MEAHISKWAIMTDAEERVHLTTAEHNGSLTQSKEFKEGFSKGGTFRDEQCGRTGAQKEDKKGHVR